MRIAVLQSAVSIKLEDVVKPAKSLFEDWMLKGKRIAPNIRNVVYIAGNYLFSSFFSTIVYLWNNKRNKKYTDSIHEIMGTGIKFGGEKEWNHCWENYQETRVSSEKLIMLEALGASTDSWLLQRYLLRSLDRDMVKSQDMETVIISVATNSDGQFLAWRHLKAYWPQIHVLLGNGSLSGLISVVVSNFFTEYDYHEVRISYLHVFSYMHNLILR